MAITIGCDPEIMLIDRDGNPRSAINIFKGGKHTPEKVGKGIVSHDNVNSEFGIEPATNNTEFTENILSVLEYMNHVAQENKLFLSTLCAADFSKSELKNKESREFGCDPDYDCWTPGMNEMPEGAAKGTLRTAGGHIHVGHEILQSFKGKIDFVRLLDLNIGTIASIVDNNEDALRRKRLYGKAGCHRPTSYGIEYRTLSNFWIKSKEITQSIFDLVHDSIKFFIQQNGEVDHMFERDKIIYAINNNDMEIAKELINTNKMENYKDHANKIINLNYEWKLVSDGWNL